MADTKKKIENRIVAQSLINRCTKLAIFDTRTFKPLINHDDLECIMATLGFVAVPYLPPILPADGSTAPATITSIVAVTEATFKESMFPPTAKSTAAAPGTTWKEYKYSAGGRFQSAADSPPPPLPRLPYPRIDGLHISSYRAFLDAVNFYLRKGDDLSSIFHIRGIPLDPVHDQNKVWLEMETTDLTETVYCHGTLDQEAYNSYSARKNVEDSSSLGRLNDIIHDLAGEHDSPSP